MTAANAHVAGTTSDEESEPPVGGILLAKLAGGALTQDVVVDGVECRLSNAAEMSSATRIDGRLFHAAIDGLLNSFWFLLPPTIITYMNQG